MIHLMYGDLLHSDCTVISHQTNCFNRMGAGIAKQIATQYPAAYEADKSFAEKPSYKLGKYSSAYIQEKPLVIYNLYGQYRYGPRPHCYTIYPALEASISHMLNGISINRHAVSFPIKIGMPYGIGAGLAGGDWSIIKSMLEKQSAAYELDIYLYNKLSTN